MANRNYNTVYKTVEDVIREISKSSYDEDYVPVELIISVKSRNKKSFNKTWTSKYEFQGGEEGYVIQSLSTTKDL